MLLFLIFFYQPVMDLRPWLCWTAVYRFREVISTSQESKSMWSRVIKSPCGFLGFIFPLFVFTPLSLSSYDSVSLLSSIFPFHFYLFIFPHTTTFPLSQFISHSFTHSLHWPLLLSTFVSWPLPLSFSSLCYPCFSGYHEAFCQNKQFTIILSIYQSQNGAATTVSSQFYS